MKKAGEGNFATVREVQKATRDEFGRGLGNAEALLITREVLRITREDRKTLERVLPGADAKASAGDAALGHGQTLKLITRLMKQAGIRKIELLEDDSIRLTPA